MTTDGLAETEVRSAGLYGARVVREFLESGETAKDQLDRAKIASAAMSSFVRLLQVQSAREATAVTILTHSTQDETEFRRLVQAALPSSAVTAALTESSEA